MALNRKKTRKDRRSSATPTKTFNHTQYFAPEARTVKWDISYRGGRSIFHAYPSSTLRADQMRLLAKELSDRSFTTSTWESLGRGGTIYTKVTKAILEHDVLIAEISELNLNVLVEVGTAMALGREPILLVDKLRETKTLRILGTMEQCYYETRPHIIRWVEEFYRSRAVGNRFRGRVVPVLEGISENVMASRILHYAPSVTDDHSAAVRRVALNFINKSSDFDNLTITDPDDTLFDNFVEQAAQIAPAGAVIGHMVSTDYRDHEERNATVALLMGLAIGWGKKVLLLQGEPSASILDLGSVLHRYTSESQATTIVQDWLQDKGEQDKEETVELSAHVGRATPQFTSRPPTPRSSSQGNAGPPVSYLGSPDANMDSSLADYYVETPEFDDALNGRREIFVGRKGIGKTANFRLLEHTLQNRQSNVPVAISPLDAPVDQIIRLLNELKVSVHPSFFYPSFWRFVIYTEIVKTIMSDRSSILEDHGIPEQSRRRIEGVSRELKGPIGLDFQARIIDTMQAVRKSTAGTLPEHVQTEVEKVVGESRMYGLERSLKDVSKRYKIFIAIDDLDKRWDPSSDLSIEWIRSLLDELRVISRRFNNEIRTAVFLRQDILDNLRSGDADYANRAVSNMRWSEEMLVDVIASRIEKQIGATFSTAADAWAAVFPRTVDGSRTTISYVISRTLMRPRDLISFCQAILDRSRQRRGSAVEPEDILAAERIHSEWMFDSVRTEYLFAYPGIELARLSFDGCMSPVNNHEELADQSLELLLDSGYTWAKSSNDVLRSLYEIGFISVGRCDGSRTWHSRERRFQDAIVAAGSPPVFDVHPAFRSYLGIASY